MKKVLLSVFMIFAIATAFAQTIPNGNFEAWTAGGGGINTPNNWQTINAGSNLYCDSASFKDLFPNGGTYSLGMVTDSGNSPLYSAMVWPGFAACSTGPVNISATAFAVTSGGFACTQRPDSISGWYTYQHAAGPDTFSITVLLTKWNGVKRDTIGLLVHNESTATPSNGTVYVEFKDTITYYSHIAYPDTCLIYFMASPVHPSLTPPMVCLPGHDGTKLRIDDLAFHGTDSVVIPHTGIRDEKEKTSIDIYPNPASQNVYLNVPATTENAGAQFFVYNLLGQEMLNFKIAPARMRFSVSDFSKGVYLYKLVSQQGQELATGRFVVEK